VKTKATVVMMAAVATVVMIIRRLNKVVLNY